MIYTMMITGNVEGHPTYFHFFPEGDDYQDIWLTEKGFRYYDTIERGRDGIYFNSRRHAIQVLKKFAPGVRRRPDLENSRYYESWSDNRADLDM